MNFKKIIILGIIVLSLVRCEFVSYKDYELKEYDGRLKWTRVVKSAEWSNRYGHAAAVFDGKMWIVGGYNPGEMKSDTYYEDVWYSNDGINWEQATSNAPWKGRKGHELVSFQNAMYLIGGYSVNEETGYRQYNNDVWKSTNGKDWIEIKESIEPIESTKYDLNWYPRMHHSCIIANHNKTDYIYLIGGYTLQDSISGRYAMKYFNDVWRSEDGISWECLANNDFGKRAEHAATVDAETGVIYMLGGTPGVIYDTQLNSSYPITNYHALWSSFDGVNWVAELDTTLDPSPYARRNHDMVYYKNSLWCLPGKSVSQNHYTFVQGSNYFLWERDENGQWLMDSDGEAFDVRHDYATVIFDDKIWILGGYTNKQGQANDVWSGEIVK